MDSNFDFANARIAIIGGGYMGQAVLGGLIGSDKGAAAALSSDNFSVVNPGLAKRQLITERYGVRCFAQCSELPKCDVVILTVVPDVLFDVLDQLSQLDATHEALYISLAAGISAASIERVLPEGAAAVRIMPNTPLSVQMGTLPLVAGDYASGERVQLAVELFSGLGTVYRIDEELMDAATVMSGCTPGFYAIMLEALVQAGVEAGLEPSMAEMLARDTMEGTAAFMRIKGQSAEDVRLSVSTEGGGTLAAMNAMRSAGFDDVVSLGVWAALKHFEEMGA